MKRRGFLGVGGAALAQASASAAAPVEGVRGRAARPGARRRWGLALGSGSVHGLAHIGVLRALERLGASPDVIAGTSAGAIVGALAAARVPVADAEAIARELDWASVGRLTLPWKGLMRNDALQKRIDEAVRGRPIEALPTPFCAVATDLLDGRSVLLRSGPTGLAVGASSSIPVLFEPLRVGGRDLVDGSLVAPVPVDAVRAMGPQFVVAIDVAYRPHDELPRGIGDIAFQMMHVMVNALIDEQLRRADFALRIELHHLMLGEWNADVLIREGERATLQAWPQLRERFAAAGIDAGVGGAKPP